MTAAPTVNDVRDGRTKLTRAIAALTKPSTIGGPSLLDALHEAIAGTQGSGNRGVPRSIPAIWCDAHDLLHEIDHVTSQWRPGHPTINDRLDALIDAGWTPEPDSLRQLHNITRAIAAWARRAQALIEPEHVKTVSAPCPVCNAATVYRRDAAGENVRQPALQVVAERGATCLACDTHWEPELFLHLVRLLRDAGNSGFDLPEGVLE